MQVNRTLLGKQLLSGSEDGNIILWDLTSGKVIRKLPTLSGKIESVDLSPDATWAVSGSDSGKVILWNMQSGQSVWKLYAKNFTERITAVRFSPDLSYVLVGSGKEVYAWNARLNVQVFKLLGHSAKVNGIDFSKDGKLIVTCGDDGNVKIWSAHNGVQIKNFEIPGERISSVSFSLDGSQILISSLTNHVRSIEISSAKIDELSFPAATKASQVRYSPDGKMLVLIGSGDDGISLVNVEDRSKMLLLKDSRDFEHPVFQKDGRSIIATNGELLRVWSMPSNEYVEIPLETQVKRIESLAISSNVKNLLIGSGNTTRLWDMASGSEVRSYYQQGEVMNSKGGDRGIFSPEGQVVTFGKIGMSEVNLWETENGRLISSLPISQFTMPTFSDLLMAISPDGKTIVTGEDTRILFWDVKTGKVLHHLPAQEDPVTSVQFSPDGKYVLTGTGGIFVSSNAGYLRPVRLWDAASGKLVIQFGNHFQGVRKALISPDSKTAVTIDQRNTVRVSELASGKLASTFQIPSGSFVLDAEMTSDGQKLLVGSYDDGASVIDLSTGRRLLHLSEAGSEIRQVAITSDDRYAVTGGVDGVTAFWNMATGEWLAKLISVGDFGNGYWLVVDKEGHYDSNLPGDISDISWVMKSDPMTPLPIALFMKEYFEPQLLPRILNGEKFKPVRALMDLNRVQPQVKIVSVTPDSKDAERAVVEVEVTGAAKDYERNGKKFPMATAASDLRLFRDGQLVGYVDGQVVKQGAKPYRKTFNVHLPSAMSGQNLTFSAYAFNDDRVKSETARQTYQVPSSVVAKKGNAYLITMGVNQFENPAWNLRFAANDAHLMRQTLTDKLQKTGTYQQVVPLSLISDENERHADKALLHAVLDRLAGKPASPLLNELPGADKLQPATPDDLVLLTFAGHGYADDSGDFYLLTQDTGKGSGKHVDAELLKHSISSEELSQWLKDVDAGDMTLIVDACQSAASVQGKDFKPGPMGSRGLGQLSFDKGMRILAASQADEYALENDKIKQGLLSFALVTNGIEGFQADDSPKDAKIMLDEWLHYGVSRVPGLAEEVKTGTVKVASRGGERSLVRVSTTGTDKPRPAQQPALFDFAKKRRQVEVAGR